MVAVDIVLVTIDGHGHFRPMMAIGEILHQFGRGQLRVHIMVSLAPGNVLPMKEFPNVNVLPLTLPKEVMAVRQNHKQFEWLHEHRSALVDAGLAQTTELNVKAVIHDPFATWARELAETLSVKYYCFFPSPMYCYYLLWKGFGGPPVTEVPGMGKIDTAKMPELPPDPQLLNFILHAKKLVGESSKLIVNDSPAEPGFDVLREEVEKSILAPNSGQSSGGVHAFGYISDYLVHNKSSETELVATADPVLEWLNKQEANSVVYVALGSWADLDLCDNIELAEALAAINQPFLWALRERGYYFRNRNEVEKKEAEEALAVRPPPCETDAHGLPIGFRDRLGVHCYIAPWVHQQAVLAHPAIRLFVTHCGWNSLTEGMSLTAAPKAFLPLAAEQHMNAEVAEKVWKVGIDLWTKSAEEEKSVLDRNDVEERLMKCMEDNEILQNSARFYREHHKHIELNAQKTAARLIEDILS